jgi:hypothetical protein
VISGIRDQQGTLHDRSIHIEMERKLPGDFVKKLLVDFYDRQREFRRKCLRWAQDIELPLAEVPNYGNDRAQDNWEPLARIAMACGPPWDGELLEAYRHLSAADEHEDDAGVLLLRDIQTILSARGLIRISSEELVNSLIAIEDAPWHEWQRGKPLTQNSVARLLRPFKIKPGTIRLPNGHTPKGYKAEQFEGAFKRYLPQPYTEMIPIPPISTATPPQRRHSKGFGDFQSATPDDDVAVVNTRKPLLHEDCGGVAVENRGDTPLRGNEGARNQIDPPDSPAEGDGGSPGDGVKPDGRRYF